jgi:GIY-YIG catalytic domain
MQDGDTETFSGNLGILPKTRKEGRQDRRQKADGCHDARTEEFAREESRGSKRGEAERSPVIYVIRCAERGGPIYVGMTTDPRGRLHSHRARFGKLIDMEVLQEEFTDETPEEAERKWINHFSNFPLLNVNKKLPPRKRLGIQEIEDRIETALSLLDHLEKVRNSELSRLEKIAQDRREYLANFRERTRL